MVETSPPILMIVEDDPSFVYLMQRYVTKCGLQMVSAGSGEEALALARQEKPAVIVLDIALPGMNGWEVLRSLKDNGGTCHIPVVMCSGLEEVRCALREGADGYMQKPVRYGQFLKMMENIGVVRSA